MSIFSRTFSPSLKFRSQSTCFRLTTPNIKSHLRPASSSARNGYENIKISRPASYVTHLELDRPKVRNAFNLKTARELIESLDDLDNDSSTRCVIISGTGADLTSGVDLQNFMELYSQLVEVEDQGRKGKLLLSFIEQMQAPFKRLYEFSKPVLCVIHGLNYGLGMELAACSDIRYCSKDARMSIREVLIGICADVGSLQEMPRLVSNQSLLRELIYTGRELTTEEALAIGFVSRVCESKEVALKSAIDTAELIASRSPVAVQGSKRNLRFSRDKPFSVGLDYNAIWNMTMLQSSDVHRAIESVLQKSNNVEFEAY